MVGERRTLSVVRMSERYPRLVEVFEQSRDFAAWNSVAKRIYGSIANRNKLPTGRLGRLYLDTCDSP
jgi:hypothetical protein